MIIIAQEIQLAQNLGAIARIMKNFGLRELRLSAPLCSPTDPHALAMSAGAEDILAQACVFGSLEDAVADLHILYGTGAAERDLIREYITPAEFAAEYAQAQALRAAGQPLKAGVLFGRERCGLHTREYALCRKIIRIPVASDFSSLNIAQAVAVIAYETVRERTRIAASGGCTGGGGRLHLGATRPATHGEIGDFLKRLEGHLDRINFWRVPAKKPVMLRNITGMFHRMPWTMQDLRTLTGILELPVRQEPADQDEGRSG